MPLWSLREEVTVEAYAGGELVLRCGAAAEAVRCADPVLREVLRRMTLGPVLLSNVHTSLAHPATRAPGARLPETSPVWPVLRSLSHLVVRSLGTDDEKGPLLSVFTLTRDTAFDPVRLPAAAPLRLSPFATLRTVAGALVVESVLTPFRVVLHRPEAAWSARVLARPMSPATVLALPPAPATAADILAYLAAAGMTAEG
ncbi:NADH oxidase [Streptomyces sp. 7R007]